MIVPRCVFCNLAFEFEAFYRKKSQLLEICPAADFEYIATVYIYLDRNRYDMVSRAVLNFGKLLRQKYAVIGRVIWES